MKYLFPLFVSLCQRIFFLSVLYYLQSFQACRLRAWTVRKQNVLPPPLPLWRGYKTSKVVGCPPAA